MQWTGLNELREKYLSFFESKGHLRLPSFPLIPDNDKSLLLINSGMAPMKKFFTGEVVPPRRRVTTCQKCIRTPDLDRVGHTARHGTFFEMLGNFSFGDYFKHEAIAWAWEFLTKELEIPAELLWPSVYENDDETYSIWKDEIGVDPSHIVRLGKEDNFWEHGSGPCGPCSEIYFDRGEKYGCGLPDCKPGCDCDRYMEIWEQRLLPVQQRRSRQLHRAQAEEHRYRHGSRASRVRHAGRRQDASCRHQPRHPRQSLRDQRQEVRRRYGRRYLDPRLYRPHQVRDVHDRRRRHSVQ